MTQAEQLAKFIVRASYKDLSQDARHQLKIRILDGLGCAIGALKAEPVRLLKEQIEEFDGTQHCTLIGGGRAAPDRAALYNTALLRYLDFNDSYLAKVRPVIPVIIFLQSWLLRSMPGKAVRHFWLLWPWPTRCSVV